MDRQLIAAAVIVDDLARPRRFLAARRSYPEWADGLWEFPGGKVEPGEAPAAAAVREVREELGADISLGARVTNPGDALGDWPLAAAHHNKGTWMRLWLAALLPESRDPHAGAAHRELRWLGPDEAASVEWLPGDWQILPSLRAILAI